MKLRAYAPVLIGPLAVAVFAGVGYSLVAAAFSRATGVLLGGKTADTDYDPAAFPDHAIETDGYARLVGKDADGRTIAEFPLKHTTVKADVVGNIARVELSQVYENPSTVRLEAIYAFPLPENAAVTDMYFRIGKRIVYSEVMKRDEAKETYEAAKAEGKTAALTEEERPNLFTQSVANIPPGESVVVVLRYVHEVPFADGLYRYTFPMTVGPRYIPAPDTDRVPDASRVTPPVVAPGLRSAHEVDVTVRLAPAPAFGALASVHHKIVETAAGSARVVTLAPAASERIPNRDLVLEYPPAAAAPAPFLLSEMEKGDRYAMLFVQPPVDAAPEMVRPKEMVFLVDVSGSMSGEPLDAAKALIRRALGAMGPDDTFQIISFASNANVLEPAPLPNTPENVKRGIEDLDRLTEGGGTEMLAGITAALDPPSDPDRLRMVVMVTDGWIGNEKEIVAAIDARLGATRFFGVGVGSAPNRYLIEETARAGRGAADYIALDEDPERAVSRLYARLDRPLLTDIALLWDGAAPVETYPAGIPDLFAGQPLVVVAKLPAGKEPPSAVTVRGRLGRKPWSARVATDFRGADGTPVLGTLWARRKITHLDAAGSHYDADSAAAKEGITALGLKFKLVTPYTSFVAVEREIPADLDVPLETILIPGELPEGTVYEAIFASAGKSGVEVTPMRVKPGDPEVRVGAPRDARSVLVRLPWAEAPLDAVWDPTREEWVARFLVPATWPDGAYGLGITVTLAGGRTEARTATIKVDTRSAAITVVSAPAALRRGEPFTLGLKPAVGVDALAALLASAGDPRGALEGLKSASEVKEVLVAAPWGAVVAATMDPLSGVYRASLRVPESVVSHDVRLEIVASDAAGNVSRRTFEIPMEGNADEGSLAAVLGNRLPGSLWGGLVVGLALVGAVALRSRARPRPRLDGDA